MRVLIAPQEFKGSLSADEAAAAIARGLRRAHPEWTLDVLPMSDGGPGLLDALRRAVKADTAAAVVHDALGRRVLGRYIRIRATGEVVIEAAQANGLMHVAGDERDALRADSRGVGELVAAALEEPTPRLIIGVGGSATTDGGAGMARALGARLLDERGNELGPGGGALADVARIDWARPRPLAGVEVVVATDVTNPLLGPNGAAAVYGPQKGATPDQVDLLEAALVRYAAVVRRSLGVDVASIAGGGAAGGLAAGLVAFLGARIESGFERVAETSHLGERLAFADFVITGEGSFDSQSLQGKVTGRIVELARKAGKPVTVLAGRALHSHGGTATIQAIAEIEPDEAKAMSNAAALLTRLAAGL
jgi:glycerate kinase